MMLMVIPVVFGALGTIPIRPVNGLEDTEIGGHGETIQHY